MTRHASTWNDDDTSITENGGTMATRVAVTVGAPSFHVKRGARVHLEEPTAAEQEEVWTLYICPVCGHYETEAGDTFTTHDGTCPVLTLGGSDPHGGAARPPLERVQVVRFG